MKKAFTLIEILVVCTIIGLLAAGGAVSYSQFTRQSRDARRKADVEQIRAALEMYRSNSTTGTYPDASTCTILQGFITPYLAKQPSDPKSTYSYYCNSVSATNTYTVSSVMETNIAASCETNCPSAPLPGILCNYSVGPYGQTCP